MIINHNIQAMNTLRQYNIVSGNLRTSTEKLSTGYRINRAADDAAGLAISETMRSQIRGLAKGVNNCHDGVSLCQVADGAMSEVDDMIHRMRELCIQSANGTNCDSDREALDDELQELKNEIDRIGNDTEFNTIQVLQGNPDKEVTYSAYDVTRNYELVEEYGDQMTLTHNRGKTNPYLSQYFPSKVLSVSGDNYVPLASSAYAKASNKDEFGSSNYVYALDLSTIKSADDWKKLNGTAITFVCTAGCGQEFSVVLDNSSADTYLRSNKEKINNSGQSNSVTFTIGTKYFTKGADLVNKLLELVNAVDEGGTDKYKNKVGHTMRVATTKGSDLVVAGIGGSGKILVGVPTISRNKGTIYRLKDVDGITDDDVDPEEEEDDLILQYGPNEGDQLHMQLPHIDCEALGITGLSAATADAAEQSLEILDDALNQVNSERSRMGAYTNRIESLIRSEDNTGENTQSAESRIRDLDMAEEVVTNSKYNILLQVGQSVLTQANQSKESVLQLLQ